MQQDLSLFCGKVREVEMLNLTSLLLREFCESPTSLCTCGEMKMILNVLEKLHGTFPLSQRDRGLSFLGRNSHDVKVEALLV